MQKDALAVILFEGLVTPEAFCKRLIEPVKADNCILEIFHGERNHFNSHYFNLAAAIREKLFTLDDLNDVRSLLLKNVIDRKFPIEAAKMLSLPSEERVAKIFSEDEQKEITSFLDAQNPRLFNSPADLVTNEVMAIALFDKLITWKQLLASKNLNSTFNWDLDSNYDLNLSSALREGTLTVEQLDKLDSICAYMFLSKAIPLETAEIFTDPGVQKYYEQLMANEPWKAVSDSVKNCFSSCTYTWLLPFLTENILSPADFTRPEIKDFFSAETCINNNKSAINLIVMLKEKRINPWQVAEVFNQENGKRIIRIMFNPETSLGQGLRDNMLDPKLLNFAKYPNILNLLLDTSLDAHRMKQNRNLLIILHEKLMKPEELEKLSRDTMLTLASDDGVIALRNSLITPDGIKNNPDELQDLDKKVKAYREDCLNALSSEHRPGLK
jgi:hypothetical protein